MHFTPANSQHIGARGEQQDAFGFSDASDPDVLRHGGFAAVLADGMGGMAHGRLASTTSVQVFLDSYRRKTEEESIAEALLRSVRDANAAVLGLSRQLGAPGQVGSTMVVCVLHENALHWISVGDSNLYLFRDGGLTLLNASHTYATYLDRAAQEGKITAEQALQDPQREALTSYLGISELVDFDRNLSPLPLRPYDRAVLASDGLFKSVPDEEIAAALLDGDPQLAVDRLVQTTLNKQRNYQDNVTVLCVQFTGTEADAAPANTQKAVAELTAEPANDVPPVRKKRTWLVPAALLLLCVICGGGYWFLNRSKPAASLPIQAAPVSSTADEPQSGQPPSTPSSKQERPNQDRPSVEKRP